MPRSSLWLSKYFYSSHIEFPQLVKKIRRHRLIVTLSQQSGAMRSKRPFGGLASQAVWSRESAMACSASRQVVACRLFGCRHCLSDPLVALSPLPCPRQNSGRRLQGRDDVATEQEHTADAVVPRRRPNRPHRVEVTPRFVRLCATCGPSPLCTGRSAVDTRADSDVKTWLQSTQAQGPPQIRQQASRPGGSRLTVPLGPLPVGVMRGEPPTHFSDAHLPSLQDHGVSPPV